jgi:hypothetical protein
MNCRDMPGISGAAALQVNKRGTVSEKDDWCYLSGTAASQKVTLLQPDDPTLGIRVTYLGDYCHGANPKPRTFKLDLNCADRMNPVPLHAYETGPCEYTISMPSVYGCPLECPVANRHLCAGNGHCAYDLDKGGARCFCNNGEFHEKGKKNFSAVFSYLSFLFLRLLWLRLYSNVHFFVHQLFPGFTGINHHTVHYCGGSGGQYCFHGSTDECL